MSRKHFDLITGFELRGDVLCVDGMSGGKSLNVSCALQDALPLIGQILEKLGERNDKTATVIPFPESVRVHVESA